MKKLILLTSAMAVAILSAGSSKYTSATADTAEATHTVSTVQIEEPTPVLITPDLTYAEVCGNVKSVKMNETTLAFNAAGNLTSGLPRLKRDKEGRISQWGYDQWGYDEYFVTWENDRPKTFTVRQSDSSKIISTYYYDNDGRLTKENILYDFPGEEPETVTRSYNYDENSFDAQGNWIVRTVNEAGEGSSKQMRTIAYY